MSVYYTYSFLDKNGIVRKCNIWKNSNGDYHRDGDLPAIEYEDGYKAYFVDGLCHRHISNGPAVFEPKPINNHGMVPVVSYYHSGNRVDENGVRSYLSNGKLYPLAKQT
jgi:hypothetical protein